MNDDPFDLPDTVSNVGPWFIAESDSKCAYGDPIQEGDTIRAIGGGYYEHEKCADLIRRMLGHEW